VVLSGSVEHSQVEKTVGKELDLRKAEGDENTTIHEF